MKTSFVVLAMLGLTEAHRHRHNHGYRSMAQEIGYIDPEDPEMFAGRTVIKPYGDYEGRVGGRSRLGPEGEKPSEWSTLPYGPYPQKKFPWSDKRLGAPPADSARFDKPAYGDSTGVWTGTLAQSMARKDDEFTPGTYMPTQHTYHPFNNWNIAELYPIPAREKEVVKKVEQPTTYGDAAWGTGTLSQ